MPLEAATYISDLIPTNPPGADPMAQGPNHIRLLKTTLHATFPAITGAVTATQTDLNAVPGLRTAMTAIQGDAVSRSVDTASTASLTITGTGKHIDAPAILQGGSALVPRGVIVMWSGAINAVPAGWGLCDGTNGTPDLRGMFILGAGAGAPYPSAFSTGGSQTYTGTTNTAGAHAHAGGTGMAGGHYHTAATDLAGNHAHAYSTTAYALTVNDIPPHSHSFSTIADGGTGTSPGGRAGPVAASWQTDSTGGGAGHAHGIIADGTHAHTLTTTYIGDHGHTVWADSGHMHTVRVTGLPPYVALGLIMKL